MSHASMLRPTEEIADFFARAPSQQEIAAFRLSDAAQARTRQLLDKNASGTLTPEEAAELDELVLLDRLITLIRSRLPDPQTVSSPSAPQPEGRHYTARELLQLPREERNRILAAAARDAEEEYRTNPDLTDFEALGEDDLYDDYPE